MGPQVAFAWISAPFNLDACFADQRTPLRDLGGQDLRDPLRPADLRMNTELAQALLHIRRIERVLDMHIERREHRLRRARGREEGIRGRDVELSKSCLLYGRQVRQLGSTAVAGDR